MANKCCIKPLTLAEILDELDNNNQVPDTIFLLPPNDGVITDEDSSDEECADSNRMNSNQLLAEVELNFNGQGFETEEDWRHIDKIKQIWINGNEEDLNLNAFFYQFKDWEGALLPPLTLSADSNPFEFFQLFMSEDIVRTMVEYTNLYATQNNKPLDVTEKEIYVFLGIVILTCYVPLPRRKLFWEDREDTFNEIVAKAMRRNRFNDIFINIHFCNNNNLDAGDKMAKIRPLADHLNKMFIKFAPMEMQLSVDEAMIPYFGRNSCKQFMRLKPVRFGYKAWVAATRLGYCVQFDLYQGRNENRQPSSFSH